MDAESERPPSRHQGSRLVARRPNVVRTLATLRGEQRATSSRVRPETLICAPADPARGEPCTGAAFSDTAGLVTLVYRSGRAIFVDVLAYTGTSSVVEARLSVTELALTGAAVESAAGGTQRLVRVELAMPDVWLMGEPHLVTVQARRSSGADSTTVRVVRAVQR